MEASQEVESVLRVTPVFRRLAAHDLHTIAAAAAVRRFERGQVIFEQAKERRAGMTTANCVLGSPASIACRDGRAYDARHNGG
jgi:signal-transduction protein with cAMP-binding, CBS, and nucleotidyltransferase domain